jgi:hypothetical protein
MDKDHLFRTFWYVYTKKGPAAATIVYNNLTYHRIAVPTFLKFTNLNGIRAYVCINIQERLKPKHIESLSKGWPAGDNDPNVINIWYRLLREADSTIKELPMIENHGFDVKFTPVEFFIGSSEEKIKSGYIIFDYCI